MNGLEALKALMEGHTIVHFRGINHEVDRFYRYSSAYTDLGNNVIGLHSGSPKKIWFRWKDQWIWNEASADVYFWMLAEADAFELWEVEE